MLCFDEKVYYINSRKENACMHVSRQLSSLLQRHPKSSFGSPVFICIGSSRVTGDSLGPIIGSQLKKTFCDDISVYGTLEMPVHALNLSSVLQAVKIHHKNDLLIAIDAALGIPEHQGYITLGRGSLSPGAGVDKDLEHVGDLYITGIIGRAGRFSHLSLQTARLSSVMPVATQISAGILHAFGYFPFLKI